MAFSEIWKVWIYELLWKTQICISKGGRREIAFANNGKRNDCIGNRYSPELYTSHIDWKVAWGKKQAKKYFSSFLEAYFTCMHVCGHIHTYTGTYMHTCTHMCTWTHMCMYIRAHATHAHAHTHTSYSSRAAAQKQSSLPLGKAHYSHTSAWFLPCSDRQSPPRLHSYRREAEDRVPRDACVHPRVFHTQGCASAHFQWLRGCQAACWSHKKKHVVGSGSLDVQLLGRLCTWGKISAGEEKAMNWIQISPFFFQRWLWKISRSISKITDQVLTLLSPQLDGKHPVELLFHVSFTFMCLIMPGTQ